MPTTFPPRVPLVFLGFAALTLAGAGCAGEPPDSTELAPGGSPIVYVGDVTAGESSSSAGRSLAEMVKGAGEGFRKMVPPIMQVVRFVLPPVILVASYFAFVGVKETYDEEFSGGAAAEAAEVVETTPPAGGEAVP